MYRFLLTCPISLVFVLLGVTFIPFITGYFARDYPVIQASTITFSSAIVCFNALADVIYAIADPRINLQ